MLPSAAWGGIFHVQPTGATGFAQPYRRPTRGVDGGGGRLVAAGGLGRFSRYTACGRTAVAARGRNWRQGPISLNFATAVELIELPGVGTKTAALIVNFRGKHGPFERVEQLLQIKGIGLRTLEKLRPLLKIE